ncbi:MAG: SAM-dependent DNA methyltransferase [Selenomonadaceae bacterium]|nr:SAM-dependent DNA methyltransferase [Selenomonadaceae bacterium]
MNHSDKFIDLINKAAGGGSVAQIFNDFLKMAATSLATFDKSDLEVWQKREQIFQDTVKHYDAEKQQLFVEMLAELGLALVETRYRDVLGESFQKLELNDRKNGQVFTPHHIGNLMGELSMDKETMQAEIAKNGYVSIVEPCCGSGAIILGALNMLEQYGINPCYQSCVTAYDLDQRCIQMVYIQLSLYGIPAVVLEKDAITQKVWSPPFYTVQFKKNRPLTVTKKGKKFYHAK